MQIKNPVIQPNTGFFISLHSTFVELEGVEPSSKQGTRELSTCLVSAWLSGKGHEGNTESKPLAYESRTNL